MAEKERFINTIKKSLGGLLPLHMAGGIAERIAEALIQDGAVFPPCKVGETVYWYNEKANKICQSVIEDIQIFFSKDKENNKPTIFVYNYPDNMGIKELGDGAYLSKEEAQKALEQRRSGTDD